MMQHKPFVRLVRLIAVVGIVFATVIAVGAGSGSSSSSSSQRTLRLAYLSYAVANPYDAPMLAAARTAAASNRARITTILY
jgi:ribose transport system substrate-binding protein